MGRLVPRDRLVTFLTITSGQVVQEVVLARECLVICGQTSTRWEDLAKVAGYLLSSGVIYHFPDVSFHQFTQYQLDSAHKDSPMAPNSLVITCFAEV